MGSRSWRRRLARALTAALPFVVIVGLFAGAVAWHLGAPERRRAEFHRLVEDDAPLARDYGDAAIVAMERKSSLESWPAYVVRIHGSGEVEFEGKAFVCVMHPPNDRVLRVTAQRLIDAMVRVGFDREPRRRLAALDQPRAVVALAHDSAAHQVDDDDGRPDTPVVAEIERQIDRVAGTARWKRIPRNDGAHVPFCPGPDGSKTVFDATGRRVPEPAAAGPAAVQAAAASMPATIVYPDDAFIALRRTACYGTCPIYTVRISGAGRVDFKGERFVCTAAPPAARVDRAIAQRLLNDAAAAGLASMPDDTQVDRTDAPSANLEFWDGRASHEVSHYLGTLGAPARLEAIERAVDAAAGTQRWLPSRADHACTRADGVRMRFTRSGDAEPIVPAASR